MALEEDASRNFLARVMRIWFDPALERRRLTGLVGENYQPEKMQVILFPNKDPSVLFDEELISKEKLQANRNYKDCGYVTLKRDANGNWDGFFDFEYNKGKAQGIFHIAMQFFDTAKEAYKAGRSYPFVDNLFSSTELLLQSRLFVISHNQKFVNKQSHGSTTFELSKVVEQGNVDPRYSHIYGDLNRLRNESRYYQKIPFTLNPSKSQEYIKTVGDLVEEVKRSLSL